jgi:putative phosphoesterase
VTIQRLHDLRRLPALRVTVSDVLPEALQLLQSDESHISPLRPGVGSRYTKDTERRKKGEDMRIGVISDIHGNDIALAAALQDLRRQEPDRIVCLGDAVQGGCEPRQAAERLQELACPVVLGNTDAFILAGTVSDDAAESVSEDLLRVRDWTVKQLGDAGLAFLRSFEPTVEIDLEEAGTILCFHGSPRSYDDVLLPETPPADVRGALQGTEANYLCGGHTHLQWSFRMDDKTFFNPGSVGVAYNRHLRREEFYFYPMAEYAIVSASPGGVAIEFKQVLIDPDALESAALGSSHPFAEAEARRFRPQL